MAAATAAGFVVVGTGVPEGDPADAAAVVMTQHPLPGAIAPAGACIGFRTGVFADEPAVRAALTLSAYEVPSGGTITGTVTVENHGDAPIEFSYCGEVFGVVLSSEAIPQDAFRLLCAVPGSIPVGVSTYPVTVAARYITCNHVAGEDWPPPCAPDGLPALPPGTYDAVVSSPGDVLGVASVPVQVTGPTGVGGGDGEAAPDEASAFQTSAMQGTGVEGTPFVVSAAPPDIDGDRAVAITQVWCGGLCGTGGGQVVERQPDGSWAVTGLDGPQWIS